MEGQMLLPIIKWAQRKQRIYIEIGVRDIKNEKFDINQKSIKFSCDTAQGKQYHFETDLYAQIDPQNSKWSKTGFHLIAMFAKKQKNVSYWPRLTAQNSKSKFILCDWDKWIDEDEEQEQGAKGLGGFDPENMQNFNDSDDQEEKPNIDDLDIDQPIEENPTNASA